MHHCIKVIKDLISLSQIAALLLLLNASGCKIDPVVKEVGGIKFVWIQGGSFIMGSRVNDKKAGTDEKPQHEVTVDGFWMSMFEITQKQYNDISHENPSKFIDKDNPVEQVSWNEAMVFCEKVRKKYKVSVRLPREAEWEYACRAGTETKYYWGDLINGDYCWYKDNSDSKPHTVGTKKPNAWGLYDMSGSVWEWCTDWYDEVYYKNSKSMNPEGPLSGKGRVIRSGSWGGDSDFVRSGIRRGLTPTHRDCYLGFRVILSDH